MRKVTVSLLSLVLLALPVSAGAFLSTTSSKSTTFTLTFGQSYSLSSYSFSYLAGLQDKIAALQARQAGITRISTGTASRTTSSNTSGFNPTMIQPVGDPKGN